MEDWFVYKCKGCHFGEQVTGQQCCPHYLTDFTRLYFDIRYF
jgi:hypothetical protein